jgi:Domain of Unknown Function (DUF1206)
VFERFARAGFVVRGLLHLTIGYLAIRIAVGSGGGNADHPANGIRRNLTAYEEARPALIGKRWCLDSFAACYGRSEPISRPCAIRPDGGVESDVTHDGPACLRRPDSW